MRIKSLALSLVALTCFSLSASAEDQNSEVTVDLSDAPVSTSTTIAGAGSTAQSDDTAEVDLAKTYGSEDSEKKVRLDTSGDDPYVLEEYSPNDYQTYDFSQVLPVKFQTETKEPVIYN